MLVNPALIAWRSGTGRKQAHCWSCVEWNGNQVLGEVKRVVSGRRVERKECPFRVSFIGCVGVSGHVCV